MKKNMLVARISNPYGPGQDYHKGVGFIDAAIKRALANETIEIWGDGKVVRDYIYIDDVCKMLYKLIDYKGEYEVFNLSSNTGTSQNEIVDAIKKMEPKLEIKYLPARNVDAKKIILATGGKSYPLTGSTGDGYEILKKLGHTITPIKPSLVPLETYEEDLHYSLQGLSLRNVKIKFIDTRKNKEIYEDFGEMLFTNFGV